MTLLVALLDGREVGAIRRVGSRFAFAYDPAWQGRPGAYPISLSMPLTAREHPHSRIEPFLWGLLPDNDAILARWGARFGVSARNVVALLRHVGEDCAGALQLVTPERRDALLDPSGPSEIGWLSEAEVAERLRNLRRDVGAWRMPGDAGQFSLAGAQPKTALLHDGHRWGVPSGRVPTTHILKVAAPDLDGHAENEHLCLCLAAALGLPVARSCVRRFEDVTAFVVERYDRVRTAPLAAEASARAAARAAEAAMRAATGGMAATMATVASSAKASADAAAMTEFSRTTPVYRVHQEDLCQALGVHPARKYQAEGGPGPRAIVDLIRAQARGSHRPDAPAPDAEDVRTFLDALVLNWLIGGTDAHAKNYSVLIGGGGVVRLAPLYDVASALPYPMLDPLRARLAMRIGGTYRLREVGWREWNDLANDLRVDGDELVARARRMATELPDRVADEARRLREAGVTHPMVDTLAAMLAARASDIARG